MAAISKNEKKVDLTRKVSVRQYVDSEVFNMGLEQYGLSVFSGENGSGGHKEWIGYKETGGVLVYMTGLDVNADYVLKIKDDEKREALITQIKEIKKVLEDRYGKDNLDPRNKAFWSKIFIDVRVPVLELHLDSPSDLLLYCGIKAGGFSEIAGSYEQAKEANKSYKFYLHEEAEVMNIKVEVTRLRNKCKMELENIYTADSEHLFLIAKVYLPIERGYSRKTSIDTLYDDINNMVEGQSIKTNLKESPKLFLELSKLSKIDLRYKAIVKECNYQKAIDKDKDNRLTNKITGNTMGKNEEDVIEYLKNPLHQEDLLALADKVDKIWK